MPAETTFGTYKALMLRDWASHRRVILLGLAGPILMALLASFALNAQQDRGPFLIFALGVGPIFISLLSLSLHLQEIRQGTLGDLLALPVPREKLAHLRFQEGILGSLAYTLALSLPVAILSPQEMGELVGIFFRSPYLLWIWVFFLAYPMPFTFRWGGKGSVAAYASFFVIPWILLGILKLISLTGHEVTPYLCFMWISRHYERVYSVLGRSLDFAVPILLILFFHRLSIVALRRVDA